MHIGNFDRPHSASQDLLMGPRAGARPRLAGAVRGRHTALQPAEPHLDAPPHSAVVEAVAKILTAPASSADHVNGILCCGKRQSLARANLGG